MCENDLLLTVVRTSYKQQEADCNCLLPRQPSAHLLDAYTIKTFISLRNRELSLYCGLKTYKIPWKQSSTPGNHCMGANAEERGWHQDQNTNDSTKLYYFWKLILEYEWSYCSSPKRTLQKYRSWHFLMIFIAICYFKMSINWDSVSVRQEE